MHQNEEGEQNHEDSLTLNEKKKKFEEYKQILEKQVNDTFVFFYYQKISFILLLLAK